MFLGVDYYPEQWDAKMLDEDLDTIVELGSNVIRIAEFSWHLMEKTEGNHDFSFFDHVIRCEEEYRRIWQYIDDNPAKWAEDEYYSAE